MALSSEVLADLKKKRVQSKSKALDFCLFRATIALASLLAAGSAFAGFPDQTYTRPLDQTTWDAANRFCTADGRVLCPQAEACGTTPLRGRPPGDVWMPVGDHPNAWVSVGQKYDERVCKTHEEVAGAAPGWGTTTGPMAVTGEPAAFLCCRPPGVGRDGETWGPISTDLGTFGCSSHNTRKYSAVLYGIPVGKSWEDACAVMPLPTLPNGAQPSPNKTSCVKQALNIQMWGEWFVFDSSCATPGLNP